jgi:hypothetical protein
MNKNIVVQQGRFATSHKVSYFFNLKTNKMKKLKISLLAIFAIVIGIAGSAFTVKPVVKKMNNYFYQYQPNNTDGLMVDANWQSIPSVESASCSGSGVICVVHLSVAPDESGNPDLNAAGIDDPSDFDALVDSRKQ